MDDAGRLARRPLGRSGLQVTPLALASGAVRGAAPKGPALTADDVEGAYHEHGINAFFVVSFSEPMVAGVRRLIDAGHRDDLVLISMASLPFGWSVRRAWAKQARGPRRGDDRRLPPRLDPGPLVPERSHLAGHAPAAGGGEGPRRRLVDPQAGRWRRGSRASSTRT